MMFDHGKYPLFWATGCFSAGILLGNCFPRSALVFFTAACVLGLAAAALLSHRRMFAVVFLLFCVVLGAVRYQAQWVFRRDHVFYHFSHLPREGLRLEGVVSSAPKHRYNLNGDRTIFDLHCESVLFNGRRVPVAGKVLVHVFRDEPLHFGERVRLQGRLFKPREFARGGRSSYRDYLRRRGIYFVLNVTKGHTVERLPGNPSGVRAWFYARRERLRSVLHEYLKPTEAAVMQAVLLGLRQEVPPRLKNVFRHSGTAHILAISGLHVGIVAAMLLIVLRMLPVPLKAQYALTVVFVSAYVLLTGARPSVVRAGVMTAIFLGGFLLERESRGLNSLAAAACVLLIAEPNNLFDIGFQLSFVSVLSILLFFPLLVDWARPLRFFQNKPLRFLLQSVVVSLSAWLGAAGLVAYYFEIVTPIGIIANLVVIPLITLIVAVGFGVLVFGLAAPGLAVPFAATLKLLLNLLVLVSYLFSRVPGGHFSWQGMSFFGVVLYYLFLAGGVGGVTIYPKRASNFHAERT